MSSASAPPRHDWILHALAAASNHRLTALRLQKTLFLLGRRRPKAVGRQFYRFRPYHYGPFAADIYHDADELVAQGFLALDLSRGQRMRHFALTEAGAAAAEERSARAPTDALEYLEAVVTWSEQLPFNVLVRAVYDEFPEMRANSIFRDPGEE